MKKKVFILSVIFASLLFNSVYAQQSYAVIKGGLNVANVSVSDDGNVDDAKALSSFQVGLMGDLNLTPCFAIQPGLIFTGKGTKTQSGNEGDLNWYRATSNPYYLEVPVNFVFKTPGRYKFFAGAGPYLGIGISGKNKVEGAILGTSFSSEENIEFSNDDPGTLNEEEGAGFGIMKRFDYGLNGLIGLEAGSMVVSVNYGLGLAKLQSGSNSGNDNNNKHRVLSFTIGLKL
ncbi:MAG TPA: porin family protein [Chitinophagaceae bacterium]